MVCESYENISMLLSLFRWEKQWFLLRNICQHGTLVFKPNTVNILIFLLIYEKENSVQSIKLQISIFIAVKVAGTLVCINLQRACILDYDYLRHQLRNLRVHNIFRLD